MGGDLHQDITKCGGFGRAGDNGQAGSIGGQLAQELVE
jgi:hypothetical protein